MRIRLQMEGRVRELALFDLGIDSKLRGCDLVALSVGDIRHGGNVAARAIVMQRKTQRPVQFEIRPAARAAVQAWIKLAGLKSDSYLFPSRIHKPPHLGTRQYALIRAWRQQAGSPGGATARRPGPARRQGRSRTNCLGQLGRSRPGGNGWSSRHDLLGHLTVVLRVAQERAKLVHSLADSCVGRHSSAEHVVRALFMSATPQSVPLPAMMADVGGAGLRATPFGRLAAVANPRAVGANSSHVQLTSAENMYPAP